MMFHCEFINKLPDSLIISYSGVFPIMFEHIQLFAIFIPVFIEILMSTKKQMPPPIKPLEGEAKVFYDKVCGYLEEMDLVFVVDAMMVFQAAVWWMIYIDSVQEILDGKEQLMVYETGHSTIHPRVTKMKMATEKVLQLFRQLGIGEEARQRLKLMAQKEAKDPLDEI